MITWIGRIAMPLLALSGELHANSQVDQLNARFEAYMDDLSQLKQRWELGALLVSQDRSADAEELLRGEVPASLDPMWARWHKQRLDKLPRFAREWQRRARAKQLAEWYADMGQPALAASAFAQCRRPRSIYDANQLARHHSRALAEAGRYAKAAERLAEINTRGWSDRNLRGHEENLASLRRLADHDGEPAAAECEYLLPAKEPGRITRLGDILKVVRCVGDLPGPQVRQVLLEAFRQFGDKTATSLVHQIIASDPNTDPARAGAALLVLGNVAYKDRDFQGAMTWWQQVVDRYPRTPSWPKALFNIGTTLEQQERYVEAIENFTRLRDADVNDREQGCSIMEPYRNYRPQASWHIGLCRLASGDPAGALEAFITTREKYPFQSWCGNCRWEYSYRYAAFEGACLEHMRRYRDAVSAYFRAISKTPHRGRFVARRLAALYEAAGMNAELLHLCDALDAHFLAELNRRRGGDNVELKPGQEPTAIVREILRIHELGRRQEFEELADLIEARGRANGPYTLQHLDDNWVADEAAKTLAAYRRQTTRMLAERAKSAPANDRSWVYYALGLSGSSTAVDLLKSELLEARNSWRVLNLTFALVQAGEAGQTALDEIEPLKAGSDGRTLRQRLKDYQRSYPNRWPDVPAVPHQLRLPTRLAEVNEEVRVLESLPTHVRVDRSTPGTTLDCWVMALRIADREAYVAVTGNNRELLKTFDDVTNWTGDHDPRFMGHQFVSASKVSQDRTVAEIQLTMGERVHRLRVELAVDEGGWTIVRVDE